MNRPHDAVTRTFDGVDQTIAELFHFYANCFPGLIQCLFNAMRLVTSNFPTSASLICRRFQVHRDSLKRADECSAVVEEAVHLIVLSCRDTRYIPTNTPACTRMASAIKTTATINSVSIIPPRIQW